MTTLISAVTSCLAGWVPKQAQRLHPGAAEDIIPSLSMALMLLAEVHSPRIKAQVSQVSKAASARDALVSERSHLAERGGVVVADRIVELAEVE